MKTILAVDALFPPLTGIGRYALNLLLGLRQHTEVTELRCFSHARWVDESSMLRGLGALEDGDTETRVRQHGESSEGARSWRTRARSRLAASPLATRTYAAGMPVVAAARLRRHRGHLFHSPNFMLPHFPGPTVATIHDLSTIRWRHCHPVARLALMDKALPRAVRTATRLITPSCAVRSEVIEHFGIEPHRVVCTPLGVTAQYTPRARERASATLPAYGLEEDGYFLCVATVEPRKNIDGLLDAYECLTASERSRRPLVLVGAAGWGSEKTQARIDRMVRGGSVRQPGYVPERDLPVLIACATALVFPAFYEGFGLPVLEAMACGTAVICSTAPALVEVAGDAGVCVDPHSAEALALAMARAGDDAEWRGGLVARGLDRAARYSWQRTVAMTLDVYRSALEEEGSR